MSDSNATVSGEIGPVSGGLAASGNVPSAGNVSASGDVPVSGNEPLLPDAAAPGEMPASGNNAAASVAVLVLGMHRSGTSALARVLNLLGVELGSDLLPAAADNENGFWEHRRIQFIHDRIFESLEMDWTYVSPMPPHWWELPQVQPYRQELGEIVKAEFGSFPLWGLKDPRLCVMLPVWRPLLQEMNCAAAPVLIFRNPAEVARSLRKRDDMTPSRAYLLWLRELIGSERDTRGLRRSITTYSRLLADWQAEARRIGADLGIQWPCSIEQIAPRVAEFIRPTSRHHSMDDDAFLQDETVPEIIRTTYKAVLDCAASGRVDDLSPVVDEAAKQLDESQPLLTKFLLDSQSEHRSAIVRGNLKAIELDQTSQQRDQLQLEAGQRMAELQAQAQHIGELEQQLTRMAELELQAQRTAELEREIERLKTVEADLEATTTQLDAAKSEIADREKARLNLQRATEQERKKLGDALADKTRSLSQLDRAIAEVRRELRQAYHTRDTLGERLRSLFSSRIWKFSAPARALARMTGKLRVDGPRLVPLLGGELQADHSWHGAGAPQFLIPIFPMRGWARVRATIHSSVASRACLYFDTGHGFHQGESFELSPIGGETVIDRLVPLRATTYLIRFDPIQHYGQYTVENFSFEPLSRANVALSALGGNIVRALVGDGSRRPSIMVGLQLLARGEWVKFYAQLITNIGGAPMAHDYDRWLKLHAITDNARQKMRATIAAWQNPPKISVVVPTYNVDESYLRACIESVTRQIYPHWELCIADDASPKPHVRPILEQYAASDPRIKVIFREKNGNISAASNSALELATGSYVALLDHDDELAEHALFRVAEAIMADPSLDMIYSDEDKMTPEGKRCDPFFKPDWSPEYFLACMYTCHLGTYRTELIRKVGGWRSEFDSAQDYDLVLRVIAQSPKIHHIPDVLYHWRTIPTSTASGAAAKPEANLRARLALQSYLQLIGREGRVEPGPSEGFHRIRYAIKGNPKVSIVIPTASKPVQLRGRQTWFVLECVSSIRKQSTYSNLEIVVIDNDDMPADLKAALAPFDVRHISFTETFNLARKMNQGTFAAEGEQLLIMNDDIEVISRDWIESMLEFSQWDEIGAVGAQLLFPNDTQQHSGVTVLDGNPGHPFYQFPADHPGYFFSSQVHRNWSAVTGACMMTRADIFKAVGGFSEQFPVNYNDVDYCLKVLKAGKRIVQMPYAKLYHHESVSVKTTGPHELEMFKQTWLEEFPRDPYYNPNLTTQTCDFRIG